MNFVAKIVRIGSSVGVIIPRKVFNNAGFELGKYYFVEVKEIKLKNNEIVAEIVKVEE